jgi:hypothetical protein
MAVFAPLLESYSASLPPAEWAGPVRVVARLVGGLPPTSDWKQTPYSGHPDYCRASAKLSLHLQRALRQWYRLLFLENPTVFERAEYYCGLSAYLSSKLFFPQFKDEFSYDLLNEEHMTSLKRSIRLQVEAKHQSLERSLALLERKISPLSGGRPIPQQVLDGICDKPRFFSSLLVAETKIVQAWARLLGNEPTWRHWEQAVTETVQSFRAIPLRAAEFVRLAPMVAIEAEAAARLILGRAPERHLEVEVGSVKEIGIAGASHGIMERERMVLPTHRTANALDLGFRNADVEDWRGA